MGIDNTANCQDGFGSGLQEKRSCHGRTSGPTRRSTKGQWTKEEDDVLHRAVEENNGKNWKKIAGFFTDRTDVQCLHRWQKVLNPELVKGPWSKEEDEMMIELVNKFGPKKWSTIARHLPGRIGKQCRERWHNHLNPSINKESWTQDEELALIRAHQIYGNRWAELSKFLSGRTDNAIKNHWNGCIKKKLDSYLESGLLAQFQGQPYAPMPTPSLKLQQSSGEENVPKNVAEEISECSHGSGIVGYTKSEIEKTNEEISRCNHGSDIVGCSGNQIPCDIFEKIEENHLSEEPPIKDIKYSVPDISSTSDGSLMYLAHMFSNNAGNKHINHHNLHEFPNTSLGMRQDFVDSQEKLLQPLMGLSTTSSGDSIMGNECLIKHPDIVDLIDCTDSFSYEISDIPGPLDSQLYYPSPTLPVDTTPIEYDVDPNPNLLNDVSLGSPEQNLSEFGLSDEQKNNAGGLFYEPPRFPTTDLPFFSCDLAQSGSDMQQEYSPLGIRRLMMSPFKMWDSPSSDDNPNGALKSVAKTFTSTPSILKKRQHDVLSPFSDKKSFKRLAGAFSPVDVIFEETEFLKSCPSPISNEEGKQDDNIEEDKENICPEVRREEKKVGAAKDDVGAPTVKQSSGILVERNLNEFLFQSPAREEVETHRFSGSSGETSRHQEIKQSETALNQAISSQSVGKSDQSDPSTALDVGGSNRINSEFEEFLMFASTPFRRGIESPFTHARSPWLFNSFTPRAEDFGYLKSPADKCYDAIGLMKQLSEHTAPTFANAHTVLGNESISEEHHSKTHDSQQQYDSCSTSKRSLEMDRRVLDFSDCGLPEKKKCKNISPPPIVTDNTSNGFSSPSYLLKGCR